LFLFIEPRGPVRALEATNLTLNHAIAPLS
jgi:hypothetical protein